MNQDPNRRPLKGPRERSSSSSSQGQPELSRETKSFRGGELILLALLALIVAVGYLALLSAQNSPPPEQPKFAVGEPVILGSVEWTVTGVARGTTLAQRPDAKGPEDVEELSLITVDLSLTNRSDEALNIGPESLFLLDRGGNRFEPATNLMRVRVEETDNMTYGQVAPNSTRQGQVDFSVPPDTSGFVLEVEDFRMFSSSTGHVDLGL